MTRRDVLRGIGAAAGTAALGPLLQACGGSDDGASTPPLQPEDLGIETLVVVMMENRSFDHIFGSRSLDEGLKVDGLQPGFNNPRPDGSLVYVQPTDLRCVADPRHSWTASRRQFNDGRNDGFVREHYDAVGPASGDEVMGYFRREHQPLSYALADEFTLCDRWFCSVMGPTWPNRFYLHSAQSNGRNNNDDPPPGGFRWTTIYDRLKAAGVPWKYYSVDLPFLVLFGNLNSDLSTFRRVTNFFDDARNGTLPAVAIVDPGFLINDDHPPHDVQRGQAFLSSIVHALGQSPQWAKSMLLLTYDEHGGFYDHVPPPKVEDERADEGFDQLGFRVPGVVISPYSKRGYVSSVQYEHSSVPAFIEWLHDLEPLTVRDANANIFLDAIDADRIFRNDPRPFPTLPVVEVEEGVPEECVQFGGSGQEELAAYADAGGVPAELDGRAEIPDTIAAINAELVRMGAARYR